MLYGICQWCLPECAKDQEGEYTRNAGFDGIELDLGNWEENTLITDPTCVAHWERQREKTGIRYPALAVNALCSYGMSQKKDEAVVKDILLSALEAAERYGIPLLQLPSFAAGSITNESEFEQTASMLHYVCGQSKSMDLVIGTENALSAEENLRLMRTVGSQNLRIFFDTQNPFAFSKLNPESVVKGAARYIVPVIHAKDGIGSQLSSRLLGQGDSCFEQTIRALKEHCAIEWVILENDVKTIAEQERMNEMAVISADIETLQKCFSV